MKMTSGILFSLGVILLLLALSSDAGIVTFSIFKCYCDQKNTFIFSLDFETLFTKQSPWEILGLNFEKKTVYLNYNFRFNGPPLLHQKGYNDVIYLECSV